jgi:hypothetical protein
MFWIHSNRANRDEWQSEYDLVSHEMPEIAKLIPAWVDFPWNGAIIGRAAIVDMIPSPERTRFVVDYAQALPEPVFWAHTLGYSRFYDAPDYVLEELRSHHGAFT